MGAITDALSASLRAHGGEVMVGKPVLTIRSSDGQVRGVVTRSGEEYEAPIVVSAISPVITVTSLVDDTSAWGDLKPKMKRKPMRGRAFKVVLALDGMPRFASARSDEEATLLSSAQFRIAPSLDYIEAAHTDMLQGRLSHKPVIWGLCPSMTSPTLAPTGKHVLSLNVGNAPYRLREGTWAEQRDVFAKRVIAKLAEYMPNVTGLISDYRIIDPTQFESQFGLVEANITHGDTLPFHMFWMRPMPGLHAYRTPTRGLYLSGNGTWPGNYISGISGHNASQAVLRDLREAEHGASGGALMVSVVAVASRAKVSPATVSRVLAGRVPVATETRARVLKAIEQLGYRPNEVARSLRAGRGRSVALVTGDIEQGIYAALAKHVQGELEALGLDLVLFNLGHRQDRLRHFLERAPSLGLRGILLSSPHVMDMEELAPVMSAAAKSGIDRSCRSARISAGYRLPVDHA